MLNNQYFQQSQLMLQILPIVAQEDAFALKGGTAINFFVRNLPRYSIDIDLTYLPIQNREEALSGLVVATENIASRIEKQFPKLRVIRQYTKQTNRLVKLFINAGNIQVKIEPNELIRGAVFPVETRQITKNAEKEFGAFVSMAVLSVPDLYGGKFCAALDRQHPRDLFDVKLLLDNEGITDDIRKAFVIYLASHSRPINELLNPNLLDIKAAYEYGFHGMSNLKTTYEDLLEVREKLIKFLNHSLTIKERQFLLSLKKGEPDWSLLDILDIEHFPAIQWKLLNIRRMEKQKHQMALNKLRDVLEI